MKNESEEIAKSILQALGCEVIKVPEANTKTADFFVQFGSKSFLIEVKLRNDIAENSVHQKHLASSDLFVSLKSAHRENSVSRTIHDAKKQLTSLNQAIPDFRLVWLHAVDVIVQDKLDQFKASLYGSETIVATNAQHFKTCYFFHQNDFFKHKEIDGAIIGVSTAAGDSVQLCLNPFSSFCHELRATKFVAAFPTSVVDPDTEERGGKAYQYRPKGNRGNNEAVLQSLADTYSLENPQTMPLIYGRIGLKLSSTE